MLTECFVYVMSSEHLVYTCNNFWIFHVIFTECFVWHINIIYVVTSTGWCLCHINWMFCMSYQRNVHWMLCNTNRIVLFVITTECLFVMSTKCFQVLSCLTNVLYVISAESIKRYDKDRGQSSITWDWKKKQRSQQRKKHVVFWFALISIPFSTYNTCTNFDFHTHASCI